MTSASSPFPGTGPAPATDPASIGAEPGRAGVLRRVLAKVPPELWLLLLVAACLNLINLQVNGTANSYYAAAVRSMSESWHAFLYGAFDPASLQMVDKPPLALWVQALSVRIFGFNSLAILVPQALMGVAAVGLTYDLVRRPFGRAGGFVAGLTLALTPTAVAVFRHNNPDALVMLLAVVSVWATARGLEHGKLRWFAIAGLAVGLGFMTKMGAALLVAPGILAAILWVRAGGTKQALKGAGSFSLAALISGAAWPILVGLTPAGSRPWVSGTNDNSIWSLITGYNGLGRLLGQDGGPGGGNAGGPGGGGPGGGGAGGMFGGDAGPLRLLNESLGSQGGWLLGAAVFAGLAILVASRLRPSDRRTGWLIAVGGAFIVSAVAFSFASGIFHPYYVSEMAPFTAALLGGGFATMLGLRARPAAEHAKEQEQAETEEPSRIVRALGAAALVAGAATTAVVLGDAAQLGWLAPVALVGTAVAAVVIVASANRKARIAAAIAATALLLTAPAVWSAQTLDHATSGTFPTGGPTSSGQMGGPGGGGRGGFGGQGGPGGAARGGFPGAPPSGSGTANGTMPAAPPMRGGNAQRGFVPPWAQGTGQSGSASGAQSGSSQTTQRQQRGGFGGGQGGPGGGGMFGGDTSQINEALTYIKATGGGTLVVSSQSGAASSIIDSGASVAGIGGFSGRESEVSTEWLAERVESGEIRWVLASEGGLQDGRTGSRTAISAVSSTCKAVSSVDDLYDCQGLASALRAAG